MSVLGAALGLIGVLHGIRPTQAPEWTIDGDTAVVAAIEETSRRLSSSIDRWTTTLIRRNLEGADDGRGSEIRGALVQGTIRRIVAATWTDRGRLITEYLFDKDALILVTQLMEPFDDERTTLLTPDGRGIVWEQRYYLVDERVRCRKIRGKGIPAAELAASLIIRARASRDIVRRTADRRQRSGA